MEIIRFVGSIIIALIILIIFIKIWMNIANYIGEKLQLEKIITKLKHK